MKKLFVLSLPLLFLACKKDDTTECNLSNVFDQTRGACDQTLQFTPSYTENINGNARIITSNCIPNHNVGLFGGGQGSLNPNAISPQMETYNVMVNPQPAGQMTPLLQQGPAYSFGILFNGVELDPIAAEPWPHEGVTSPNVNWEWNLEALNTNLGLDCNNAHVQPNGKYHYHGPPTLFLDGLNIQPNTMTLIGYAADGYPIYYKYAYSDANNSGSNVIEMTSSYRLKSGERPGDGNSAPCGTYDGVYSNDYEYVQGLGTLDQANGRTGVTPEYPGGTYYYIITDDFPAIPRYFKGTPSADFQI